MTRRHIHGSNRAPDPRPAAFALAGLLAAGTLLAGCERPPEEAAASSEVEVQHGPFFPPWVLDVQGAGLPFDAISFKDAGMTQVQPPDRPEVYESIARALAAELEAGGDLRATARHSAVEARPEGHLHCAPRHIYVDYWQSARPARWGFALWSGCTDEQRFARHELPVPAGADDAAMITELSRSIAQTLRQALRTGCFTRGC